MDFFVYVYLDPRKEGEYIFENKVMTHQPFYVGIDKNNRHLSYLKETLNNTTNKAKFYKINNIKKEGFEPIVLKIYESIDREKSCSIILWIIEEDPRGVFFIC